MCANGMTIITASDFRASQGKWMGRLAAGEKIIVRSRLHGDMQVSVKPLKSTKTKRQAKADKETQRIYDGIRRSLQDWKDYLAGDKTKMRPIESLLDELRRYN